MTTDEVILRRDRAVENGEEYRQPPPRLRGQTTYLALLTSLATDLDIMLNDLRASPNTRQSSNIQSHAPLHQRSSSTPSYSPLSRNVGTTTASGEATTINHTDYLENVLRSNSKSSSGQESKLDVYRNYQNPRTNQQYRDEQTSSALSSSSTVTVRQQQNVHQRLKANPNSDHNFNHQTASDQSYHNTTNNDRNNNFTSTSNLGREESLFSNAKTGSYSNSNKAETKTSISYSSSSVSSLTSFQRLSTDVTRVSKLPLYTYQHKQLQQPQTLHIKLLQQQQATKAIASQITDIDRNFNSQNVVHRNKKQLTIMSDGRTTSTRQNVSTSNTSTRTTTTNPLSTTSTSLDFQIKSSISTSGSNCAKVGKSTQICKINSLSTASSPATSCNSWQLQSTTADAASKSKLSANFLR